MIANVASFFEMERGNHGQKVLDRRSTREVIHAEMGKNPFAADNVETQIGGKRWGVRDLALVALFSAVGIYLSYTALGDRDDALCVVEADSFHGVDTEQGCMLQINPNRRRGKRSGPLRKRGQKSRDGRQSRRRNGRQSRSRKGRGHRQVAAGKTNKVRKDQLKAAAQACEFRIEETDMVTYACKRLMEHSGISEWCYPSAERSNLAGKKKFNGDRFSTDSHLENASRDDMEKLIEKHDDAHNGDDKFSLAIRDALDGRDYKFGMSYRLSFDQNQMHHEQETRENDGSVGNQFPTGEMFVSVIFDNHGDNRLDNTATLRQLLRDGKANISHCQINYISRVGGRRAMRAREREEWYVNIYDKLGGRAAVIKIEKYKEIGYLNTLDKLALGGTGVFAAVDIAHGGLFSVVGGGAKALFTKALTGKGCAYVGERAATGVAKENKMTKLEALEHVYNTNVGMEGESFFGPEQARRERLRELYRALQFQNDAQRVVQLLQTEFGLRLLSNSSNQI